MRESLKYSKHCLLTAKHTTCMHYLREATQPSSLFFYVKKQNVMWLCFFLLLWLSILLLFHRAEPRASENTPRWHTCLCGEEYLTPLSTSWEFPSNSVQVGAPVSTSPPTSAVTSSCPPLTTNSFCCYNCWEKEITGQLNHLPALAISYYSQCYIESEGFPNRKS